MPWPIAVASVLLAIIISFPLAYLFELGGDTIWAPAILHFVIQATVKVIVFAHLAESFALLWMAVECCGSAGDLHGQGPDASVNRRLQPLELLWTTCSKPGAVGGRCIAADGVFSFVVGCHRLCATWRCSRRFSVTFDGFDQRPCPVTRGSILKPPRRDDCPDRGFRPIGEHRVDRSRAGGARGGHRTRASRHSNLSVRARSAPGNGASIQPGSFLHNRYLRSRTQSDQAHRSVPVV